MAGRTRGYGCSADRPEKRTPTVPDRPPTTSRRPTALLRAAHIGPALAVTVIVGLLAMAADLPLSRTVLVVAAVLTGQLSIGWANDPGSPPPDRPGGRSGQPRARGGSAGRGVRAGG